MAGHPNARARALAAEARVTELETELAQLRRQVREKGETHELARAVTFDAETVPRLVHELFAAADEGETIEEVAARWNVSPQEIRRAGEAHELLGEALRRAHVRSRARVHGMIRRAVESGRGFPAAMVDRLLALYDRDDRADADAASLITAQLTATQRVEVRCTCCTGACQTRSESDAVSGGPSDPADE